MYPLGRAISDQGRVAEAQPMSQDALALVKTDPSAKEFSDMLRAQLA
jgi:hypothetical protein